jgi:Cu-Zn family superoxide dismutase
MKKSSIFTIVFALIFATSCKKDTKATTTESTQNNTEATTTETSKPATSTTSDTVKKVVVPLTSKSNNTNTGTVIFKQEKGFISMIALVSGLNEGEYVISLSNKETCTSENANSQHNTTIGSITVNKEGNGTVTFTTNEWCIGCDDSNKNIMNKAVIVHQGHTKDLKSSAIICCGVIE